MNAPALALNRLGITFGGLKAVSDLNLQIQEHSIFGLIGPNGAGKTTVFNLLTGVYRPTQGSVHTFGKKLSDLKPHEITHQGLARTFQNIRLFKDLSVEENLLISMDHSPLYNQYFLEVGLIPSVLKTLRVQSLEKKKQEKAKELLEILGLLSHSGARISSQTLARNLPYGHQRRLEIARALATGAKILLLDEPAAGMNAQETATLMATLQKIRKSFGVTLFLIEHDMKLVMGICERIAVLDYGIKIAEGTPQEIQKNPKVIEAYLGTQKNPKKEGS